MRYKVAIKDGQLLLQPIPDKKPRHHIGFYCCTLSPSLDLILEIDNDKIKLWQEEAGKLPK